MKDERVEQAKNKVRSEMATIMYLGIVISFLVKTLAFKMNLWECITEYVILIFFPLYQFIRMHMMKIGDYSERGDNRSIKNLLIAIIILVAAAAVLIFNLMKKSVAYNWQSPVVFLFIFVVIFVLIFFAVNRFNKYRGHEYEREFDDET